jgi:hypothetical protein
MDDFTIYPLVDADVVQKVESTSPSDGPLIAPRLPGDNIQPDFSSFDGSDTIQSDELLCPDDYVDASEDETESLPGSQYDAGEIVHPRPADIPRNIDIISGILQDPLVLRLNSLGDALLDIIPFTDPVPMATVPHRAFEIWCEKLFLTSGLKSPFRSRRIFMHSPFESRILLARFVVLYRTY